MRRYFKIIKVLVIIAIILMICNHCSATYNPDTAWHTYPISWDSVNAYPHHHSFGDEVTTFSKGQKVTLTGNEFHYLGGEGKTSEEDWVEIDLGGTAAWIVSDAIRWP